jgi:hypothetical protein
MYIIDGIDLREDFAGRGAVVEGAEGQEAQREHTDA